MNTSDTKQYFKLCCISNTCIKMNNARGCLRIGIFFGGGVRLDVPTNFAALQACLVPEFSFQILNFHKFRNVNQNGFDNTRIHYSSNYSITLYPPCHLTA